MRVFVAISLRETRLRLAERDGWFGCGRRPRGEYTLESSRDVIARDMKPFPPVRTLPIARAVLVGMLAVGGCSPRRPLEFRLNTEGRERSEIRLAQIEEITGTLEELFGTPDRPEIPEEVDLRRDLLEQAAGPVSSNEQGRQFGLYRQHCAACHGISGDGAGPIAASLNPYPRDFRHGVYKYTSTAGGAKPVREDLLRALRDGNPGTAMPSFRRLSDEQLDTLVQYVQYLSFRGETELFLLVSVVDADDYPLDTSEVVEDGLLPVVDLWAEASTMAVQRAGAERKAPPIDTEQRLRASIDRGYQMFAGKNAQCIQCHGREGKGDGEQSELYDDWNKRKKGVGAEQTRRLAARFALPIQRLRPRNFTQGVFRGGQRPIDLYWRIHAGIKGTPMPAAGPAPGISGALTPEKIWDVVNYVRSRAGSRR